MNRGTSLSPYSSQLCASFTSIDTMRTSIAFAT
jgi:hypothetical protein